MMSRITSQQPSQHDVIHEEPSMTSQVAGSSSKISRVSSRSKRPSGSSIIKRGSSINHDKRKHACILMTIVCMCMFICWTPLAVTVLVKAFNPALFEGRESIPAALLTLGLLNSLMNIVIYMKKDKSFRQRSKQIALNFLARFR